MKKFKRIWILTIVVVFMLTLAACGASNTANQEPAADANTGEQQAPAEQPEEKPAAQASGEKVKAVVWGLNPMSVGSGNKEMIDEFNKTHPNIEMVPQTTPGTPGYETQDLTKLTAAIAAGTPPDAVWLNAPFIMEVAARGVLTPLDDMIKTTGLDMNQYYEYTVNEMTFDGHVWGLPWDVDSRILFYNKGLFKKAGLDPEQPPKTWDELLDYSKKLTVTSSKGEYEQIGFIPNFGNSWLYLYSIQNKGKLLSEDGKTCLLNSPENAAALDFMLKGYDLLGGAKKINAYTSTFQGEANDPFITGKVAMLINVNNAVTTYARFGQNLDYGVAMPPTPTGSDFKTWSGGWAYGVPKGAKNADEGFEIIKWLTTEGMKYQAQGMDAYNKSQSRITIPFPSANKNVNDYLIKTYVEPLENETIKKAAIFGMDALQYSTSLPVSPMGQLLWAEHARAIDKAIYKEMTPQAALDAGTQKVQADLNKFWAEYKPE